MGRPKQKDWDRLQVVAQAICLEEMYQVSVREGCLFYGETRRRETVAIDETLRNHIIEMSSRMHGLFEHRITPKAAVGVRCKRCSLLDACVPELSAMDARLYWELMGEGWY